MPTVMIKGVEYDIFKSRHITGHRPIPRTIAYESLKYESILNFWRSAVRAIWNSPRCCDNGEIFTSDEMDVFLGPWSIDIRHHIESFYERRYDVDFGEYETVHVRDDESFEVAGAFDADNDENLPGLVGLLNAFYKKHESEIFRNL